MSLPLNKVYWHFPLKSNFRAKFKVIIAYDLSPVIQISYTEFELLSRILNFHGNLKLIRAHKLIFFNHFTTQNLPIQQFYIFCRTSLTRKLSSIVIKLYVKKNDESTANANHRTLIFKLGIRIIH